MMKISQHLSISVLLLSALALPGGLWLSSQAQVNQQPLSQTPSSIGSPAPDTGFVKIISGAIVNDGGFGFGCAWGDYDGDGFIDLFVCNYWDGNVVPHDFLYHNRGDGTFERITAGPLVNANAWATAAAWGDFDNDGQLDLFVARPGNNGTGPNTLYHNDGQGHFSKVTTGLLVTQTLKSHAGIWADFDNDGLLDLVVANFRSTSAAAFDNYLYHNNGDGTFQRLSFGAKSASNGDSFDAAAADLDNDGWIDLVFAQGAANNKQTSLLYRNNQSGTLQFLPDSVVSTTLANSAAAAWGDYDNDGFLDLFICTNPEGRNLLYHNNGNGTFTLLTNSVVGLEVGSSAGCAWGDYDNDGWLDLFVARIGKYDSNFNVTQPQNNCLYHNNRDGSFTKVTSGAIVNEPGYSFGCAWGDYDNDGFLDLFVSNGWIQQSKNNFLYHNGRNTNNWINFKLVGTVSNRSAIGAKVRVKATIGGRAVWQMREVSGGSGHGCQNDMRANFGLGDATNVDLVRIEWPSGIVQSLTDVASKEFLTVVEHQAITDLGTALETGLARSTDGQSSLLITGPVGLRYLVEGSTNLLNWTWLGSTTNLAGRTQFIDSRAVSLLHRFYRVTIP
jgi:hypothetical protein